MFLNSEQQSLPSGPETVITPLLWPWNSPSIHACVPSVMSQLSSEISKGYLSFLSVQLGAQGGSTLRCGGTKALPSLTGGFQGLPACEHPALSQPEE